MLEAILIAGFVGACIGIAAFYFGHSVATRYWEAAVESMTKAKQYAENELARLRQKL